MCGAAVLSLALMAGQAQAQQAADRPVEFNIAAQPLSEALNEFARQSGRPVMFTPGVAASKTTRGASGEVAPDQALQLVLAGTGLEWRRSGDTYLVVQQGEGGGPQDESAAGGGAEVEALIVTAQKKEEAIQDVPIAISAFTQKSLDAQKIEGGFDLLKAIPNVTFSKNNFSGYNFSIRGIGTKAVSATTDPGVAVSFNSSTLIVNRLFEQEYFDVERVEVLRGPQGTLYGRNATSGVINVISAKPRLGEFEGEVKLEGGNYNAQRARGMVNIPIGDTLAVRAAGAMTKRDGYGFNEFDGSDVDNRDLWSTRVTVGWEPTEAMRFNLLWERFSEDDERVRTSKQLCHHDPGLANEDFENVTWDETTAYYPYRRATTSQGCLPGSLYDTGEAHLSPEDAAGAAHGAFGTPNGASLPFIAGLFFGAEVGVLNSYYGFGYNPFFNQPLAAPCPQAARSLQVHPVNTCLPDPYGALGQSRDLRTIHSTLQPQYRAKADIFELSFDWDLTDDLTFTSQTVFAKDEYYATQDYNRFTTLDGTWADSSTACATPAGIFNPALCNPGTWAGGVHAHLSPGGVLMDPQLGPSRTLLVQDISQAESEQFNQEFRLASNYDGPFNFSLGANYTRFETLNDYYVISNAFTLITYGFPFNNPIGTDFSGNPQGGSPCATRGDGCTYVDPNPIDQINGEGHNYFRSANPYQLTSSAMFGELYWQATDTLKVTVGGRMTWDQKVFTPIPSQLLLRDYRDFGYVEPGAGPETCQGWFCYFMGTGVGGRGSPPNPDIIQEWREPTGRLIVDWKPDLGFTDETMVYGSLARGYKGGGANPPSIAPPAGYLIGRLQGDSAPPTFEAEYITAYEAGTKNTLLGGGLILNGSAFYYDYEGYQISKIVDRSAANENFDTKVWGLELEWIFSPTRNLRFNGTFGHLRTEIAEGERSIDLMDRAQGGMHTSWTDRDGVEHALDYDEWIVLKPWITSSSNCVAPKVLAESVINSGNIFGLFYLCPPGGITGGDYRPAGNPYTPFDGISVDVDGMPGVRYDPTTQGPNGGAGFFSELGGNELPNAPHYTASLGAQYRMSFPGGWDATLRGDFYWQSQSYARVYNTQYDKLRAWTNTNVSLWVENADWGVTAEVYVKNVFDESPITDAFLNSDDSGLTTNVFTLDPRLVGVSVRKSF